MFLKNKVYSQKICLRKKIDISSTNQDLNISDGNLVRLEARYTIPQRL